MKSYKPITPKKTSIKANTTYEAETLETKIQRILNNKEPITDAAPIIYTNRADGVQPAYNIRTDRFEVALEATDSIAKGHIAEREKRQKAFTDSLDKRNEGNKPEPMNKPTGNNTSDSGK